MRKTHGPFWSKTAHLLPGDHKGGIKRMRLGGYAGQRATNMEETTHEHKPLGIHGPKSNACPATMGQVRYICYTRIFVKQKSESRTEFRARYDVGADLEAIKGIGPRRAALLGWLLTLDQGVWVDLTGMAA